MDRVEKNYDRGIITARERYNQLLDIWSHCREQVQKKLVETLKNDRRDEQGNETSRQGILELMEKASQRACSSVHQEGVRDESKRGMGTTCTTLLIAGSKAIMGHVGDSRLYLSRAGQLHTVSQDHTYVNEAVRHGIMTREEALASGYGNIVTRAVGPHENVLVDTLVFDVLPHDRLLLCSDGLHGYFENPVELVTLMRENDTERLAGKLIGMALNQIVLPGFATYHIGVQTDEQQMIEAAANAPENAEAAASSGDESPDVEDGDDVRVRELRHDARL